MNVKNLSFECDNVVAKTQINDENIYQYEVAISNICQYFFLLAFF